MSLPIFLVRPTGGVWRVSVVRALDLLRYDFADQTFKASGWVDKLEDMVEGSGDEAGLYSLVLATPAGAQWTDGEFIIRFHSGDSGDVVEGIASAVMHAGSSEPVFPSGAGVDPWGVALPGSYPAGSAGYMLGTPAYFEAAIFDTANTVETGETFRQWVRMMRAEHFGLCSVVGLTPALNATFKRKDNTTTSLSVTYDENGNRTVVVPGSN